MARAPDAKMEFAQPRERPARTGPAWKILIADDDESVHQITRLTLTHEQFDGRGIELLSAFSASEARAMLAEDPDIALILLDVVMESESAGLDLVRTIRGELSNAMVRILLRTGQPGHAPLKRVIADYEINDYLNKAELTAEKLFAAISTALRSYRDLLAVRQRQRKLEAACKRLEHFAVIAAHDLREPLRGILSFSQLLARDVQRSEPAKIQEHLAFMKQSVKKMESLVDGLREYVETLSKDPDYSPAELNEVMTELVSSMREDLPEKGQE